MTSLLPYPQTPDGSSLPSPTTSMQSYLRSLNRSALSLVSPTTPPAMPSGSASNVETPYGCRPLAPAGGPSANPGLPYLQHILDDVQIVRDKKPASYYRSGRRPGSSAESLLGAVRRLGECSVKLATPVE